jgi:hypothetical protein
VSAAITGIIAENVVILAAIGAGWRLFRQGGGWQFKTPPVPKAAPQPHPDAAGNETSAFDRALRRPA